MVARMAQVAKDGLHYFLLVVLPRISCLINCE